MGKYHPTLNRDANELWSFLRRVMTQGQDIALDYRERGYEEMSARLDVAASERVDQLLKLLEHSPVDGSGSA
jgi:hypothetical protein